MADACWNPLILNVMMGGRHGKIWPLALQIAQKNRHPYFPTLFLLHFFTCRSVYGPPIDPYKCPGRCLLASPHTKGCDGWLPWSDLAVGVFNYPKHRCPCSPALLCAMVHMVPRLIRTSVVSVLVCVHLCQGSWLVAAMVGCSADAAVAPEVC